MKNFKGGKMTIQEFKQEEFNKFELDNSIIGLFEKEVTLKSKRKSRWYVNWRNPLEDVYLREVTANYVLSFVNKIGLEVDTFYGVPEGATKLGLKCQDLNAKNSENYGPGSHALPMGRGKPKSHGDPKDRYFLGIPRGKTVVIEDVTTTGGSLLETIANLKEAEVNVVAAIGLTNRMELTPIPNIDDPEIAEKFREIYKRAAGTIYISEMSVKEAVNTTGVKYFAMSNGIELLPMIYKKLNPGIEIARSIEKEFEIYGVEKLKLEV